MTLTPFSLGKFSVDEEVGVSSFFEFSCQDSRSVSFVDENHDLVVLEVVENSYKFADFVLFIEVLLILEQTVQHQFRLVFNDDFDGVVLELDAFIPDFAGYGTRKHHGLFFFGCFYKNLLHVGSHFVFLDHSVAFVDNEIFYVI